MRVRWWFWVEQAAAVVAVLVAAAAVIKPTWFEAVFGVDPDAGSGAVEWWYAALAAAVAVGSSLLARAEVRRSRAGTR
jgi:hypothetical protein